MISDYLKLDRDRSVFLPQSKSFEALNGFLYDRFNKLRKQATFLSYLVIVVLGVGALGVWAEIAPAAFSGSWDVDLSRLASALYTYFPAIAVASCFDLAMFEDHPKVVRSFGIYSLLFVSFWAVLCAMHPQDGIKVFLGLVGSVFAIFLWWIANGENANLNDTPFDAPAGGLPTAPLAGSLEGFSA